MPRWLHCLVAASLVSGCAGSSKNQSPSWRRGDDPKAPESTPQRLVFAPEGAPADAYNQPPFVSPPQTDFGDAIIHQVNVLAIELGKPAPTPDGRLFAAAEDLAIVSPDEGTVAYRLVEFALQRHGIIEPSPHLVVMRAAEADHEAILTELGIRLTQILAQTDFTRIGVGFAPRADGESVIVLALQSSAIETGPIPRQIAAGQAVKVKGRVAAPYREPHVYITRASGDVETLPLQVGSGGAFEVDLSCRGQSGRQQIEITASDHTGSTVLANFPLWCGEAPPNSITIDYTDDDSRQFTDVGDAETRMIALINRDRAAQGLDPIVADERVAAVARAHSKDMLETGVVGHVSPNTGNAADRVNAAGIRTAVVLENVARAYGLGEAQDGLMNSPGHRANILSKSATHVGVGIVLGKEVADRREMFITQVFIRIPAAIERETVIAEVARVIRTERKLADDPALAEVAQKFADELAQGATTGEAAARASARLHEKRLSYRGVTTLATTVADLASFETGTALSDRSIGAMGIGVAQGDHPDLGDKAISIVVLFGHN